MTTTDSHKSEVVKTVKHYIQNIFLQEKKDKRMCVKVS